MSVKFLLTKCKTESNLKPCVVESVTPCEPREEYGYTNQLDVLRDQIDKVDTETWKKVRWYINEYDFQVRDPIINRAFYKYWEIINEFDIFRDYTCDKKILHCAEAPGGFIQGTNIYLQLERQIAFEQSNKEPSHDEDGFIKVEKKKHSKRDAHRIYTISLNKDLPQYRKYNLPSYNKNVLNKFVCVSYGKDRTGDINNIENILHIRNNAMRNFHLITADGGFDEGNEFNHKEQLHYYLILNEILCSIIAQEAGGNFILKIFDMFTEPTVHMIFFLTQCFEEVFVYKPKTSRPTNSERYIVCKNFCIDEDLRIKYCNALKKLSLDMKKQKQKFCYFRLYDSVPELFIKSIFDSNIMLTNKQCGHLKYALELCKDEDFVLNYDDKLAETLELRRSVFLDWQNNYDLSAFV